MNKMNDCCSTTGSLTSSQGKHVCPVNGRKYKEVQVKTVLHHIREPWAWEEKDQAYYFCDDPECSVVYFGEDDSIIETEALRTAVGIKEKSQDALVCYCFGVSFKASTVNDDAQLFVTEKTKQGMCACEIQNPSGKCCLKDFPKQ